MILWGHLTWQETGSAVAFLDDMDGTPDLAIGAPSGGGGAVYGLDGAALLEDSTPTLSVAQVWYGEGQFGSALAASDVTGDGYADAVIGARTAARGGAAVLLRSELR